MWYLILALLFGQGNNTAYQGDNSHPTTQSVNNSDGGTGGETGTVRPPRPPKKNK